MPTVPTTPLRLLIITPNLHGGGAERNVVHLCNHLTNTAITARLLIVDNRSPFYMVHNTAIEIVDLQTPRVRSSLFAIRKQILDFQPDVVLSTSNYLSVYLMAFRFLFPRQVRFVCRETSIASINNQRSGNPGLLSWMTRRFYQKADQIVCQSAFMKTDLETMFHIPPDRLTIIENMVEVPVGSRPLASTKERPVFITVARLSVEKGISRILAALSRLQFPFEYHVVGEGSEREKLESIVRAYGLEESVFFRGAHADPFSLVPEADLFLQGSLYEGFPNVLLESAARGIPCVAYDVPGGTASLIHSLSSGLLVSDGDEQGYAAAIERSIQTTIDPATLIQRVRERHSPAVITPQWEALFRALIANNR
jgi:glycosyltransferase involved in cell wall biosynthesis